MRKILIITLGIFIFFLLLLGVTFLESLKKKNSPTVGKEPSQKSTRPIPTIIYDQKSSKKMLEIAINKPTLPPRDLSIRNSIIDDLADPVTEIFKSELIQIKYVKGPNDFEGRITSIEITQAKLEAINFFKARGLSEVGICNLPLVFYPSIEIKEDLQRNGTVFEFLPDFCI